MSPASRRMIQPARHAAPAIDAAALAAAVEADRVIAAATTAGAARWVDFLGTVPDLLRDGDLDAVRLAARRARAALGPGDSVREVLPAELTDPFRASVDRLLRLIAQLEAQG